jgi:hypothetical protein
MREGEWGKNASGGQAGRRPLLDLPGKGRPGCVKERGWN